MKVIKEVLSPVKVAKFGKVQGKAAILYRVLTFFKPQRNTGMISSSEIEIKIESELYNL